MMVHDFKKYPELRNSQLQIYYLDSPHRQIIENFTAKVIKVIDGDTIKVKWEDRDFNFPIRMAFIAAPEIKEEGGKRSQQWLEKQILGKDVDILIRLAKKWSDFWDINHAITYCPECHDKNDSHRHVSKLNEDTK